MKSPIRITYDGKLAVTIAQAARRYGLTDASMRNAIMRLRATGAITALPDGLDARSPLYLARDLDAAMKARPGRPGRRRPAAAKP